MGQNEHTRMLIIDDDVDLCDLMRGMAEDKGYDVRAFNEGTEFLKAYDSLKPDRIVMDLSIPDYDGIALMKALGERGCREPIVVVSSHPVTFLAEVPVLGKAYGLDIRLTLQKPFKMAAFMDAV